MQLVPTAAQSRRTQILAIWYRIPWLLRLTIVNAGWLGYGILLLTLNEALPHTRTFELVLAACGVGVSVSVLVDSLTPEVFGSVDELLTYSRALKTGDLPDGIDFHQWLRRVRRSHLAIIGAALLAFLYLAAGLLSASSTQGPYRVVLLWVFGLSGLCGFGLLVRRVARIQQLDSELKRRAMLAFGAARAQVWVLRVGRALPIRFVALTASGTVVALLTSLTVAVLISDGLSRSHLLAVTIGSACIGLLAAALRIADPRLRATPETVRRLVEYDRARIYGHRPAHFGVDEWRHWLNRQRRSDRAELLWAAFFFGTAFTCALGQPSGVRWVVAVLLGLLSLGRMLGWVVLRSRVMELAKLVGHEDIRRRYG